MIQPWLELAAAVMTAVLCGAAGWRAASRATTSRKILAAIGFAVLAWPIGTGLLPDRLYHIYPAFPLGEALFGTAFFLTGVLARAYSNSSLRRILQGVLAVASVWFVLAEPVWFAFNAPTLRAFKGRVSDGVTLQTELFTCVPSSLATVLRRWGIESTEGEVAYRMRTTFQGTSPNKVPHAARDLGAARGLQARIVDTTFESLLVIDRPAILVGYAGRVRHAVALVELDERMVAIGDPLKGLLRVPRSELTRHFVWNGLAIVVDSPSAGPAAPRLRPQNPR